MTGNGIKYPVGIQDFRKLRSEGFLYVDKTPFIASLVSNQGYYFLSRPRRFGKSLLLSTIAAFYRGERQLFKGLAIDRMIDDWTPHPVLHLDLNSGLYDSLESFNSSLESIFIEWQKEYDVDPATGAYPLSVRFGEIIKRAYEKTGQRVVILIDEYDKPLLNAIENQPLANSFRDILKAIYSNLKTRDQYIELAVITGVARFSKISIFSDLNNLRDISFVDQFAGICGITSEEIDQYFLPGIDDLARAEQPLDAGVRQLLREKYDGYHFSANSPDIYNPFSLINTFANRRFGAYWFETGTPSYLVRLIERGQWLLRDLAPIEIDASTLETAGIFTEDPIPPLYQSGYLTIKSFDPVYNTYTLDYPNQEVREGFFSFLIPYYLHPESSSGRFSVKKFLQAVNCGDIEAFMASLESLIASIPYASNGLSEAHFQNACYLIFSLMGQYVKTEERTSDGRIDLTLETPQFIYLFEFKINASAQAAINQIKEKKYWIKYQTSGKEIFLIGANFDSKTRRLSDYLIEKINN